MKVTIGIDIGTTSVKAVIASEDGTVLGSVRLEHADRSTSMSGEFGRVEHDAARVWRESVLEAATGLAHQAVSSGHRVIGVQVAAMVPSMCAVDESGVPLGEGLLYGDQRTIGGKRGADPSTSAESERMLALLTQLYPEAAGYWPAQAVANAALCGTGVVDSVTAMTMVPLFDFSGWDEAVLQAAGATAGQLPRISFGAEPAGMALEQLGPDLSGAVIGGGTIDAFAEQLVAGADQAGDVLVIIGATLIIWAVVPDWVEIAGLWTVPHTAPGMVLVGGPSNAGGLFRNWAGGSLSEQPANAEIEPTSVPVWLPFIRGERTPLHDPTRRAELHDVDITHGPASMWRSVYEAAGFVTRRHLELAGLLEGGGGLTVAKRLVVTGGGSQDNRWVQAIADVTGLAADCVAVPQGAALGSAYLARVAAGEVPDASGAGKWARVGKRIEPDSAWSEAALNRYERFVELSGPPFQPEPESRES
ncbi:unannotated protein [freshwater metagenome]|nr:xylulose kinase [Actinomycetota bacterium]MSV84334.1 xylulose kinase [Actinomycetota bacterium]MSX74686.1 xylulose kinase [Actinomycetota bacterium]